MRGAGGGAGGAADARRATKPGGYVELAEAEGIIYDNETGEEAAPGNGYRAFLERLAEAMRLSGRAPVATASLLKGFLKDAGFENVVVSRVKQPWGPWPKDPKLKQIGAMNLLQTKTGEWRAVPRVRGC